MLVTTLGTPWAPDFDGAVVFLEDVHEWPYRLDRLLTHLRQSGCSRPGGRRGASAPWRPAGPSTACRRSTSCATCSPTSPYPVALGLPAGHANAETDVENLALPFGVEVELDAGAGRLVACEAAVV